MDKTLTHSVTIIVESKSQYIIHFLPIDFLITTCYILSITK